MKRRVMLVDDDPVFGCAAALGLESVGYEVHYQTTGTNLNGMISSFDPDVLILDVEIGSSNGIELAPFIKVNNHRLPIIFISSHCETSYVTAAIESGGDQYLRKPFEIEELITYIRKYTNDSNFRVLNFGNSKLNSETRELFVNNQNFPIQLSRREDLLLKLLVMNKNNLVSKVLIQNTLYGDNPHNDKSINNTVSRLRNLISNDTSLKIENIKNGGYLMTITE